MGERPRLSGAHRFWIKLRVAVLDGRLQFELLHDPPAVARRTSAVRMPPSPSPVPSSIARGPRGDRAMISRQKQARKQARPACCNLPFVARAGRRDHLVGRFASPIHTRLKTMKLTCTRNGSPQLRHVAANMPTRKQQRSQDNTSGAHHSNHQRSCPRRRHGRQESLLVLLQGEECARSQQRVARAHAK
jgi:hypothetical protein